MSGSPTLAGRGARPTQTSQQAGAVDFMVARSDLGRVRFASAPAAEEVVLEPGEALLAVDKLGLTANNITLAAFGNALSLAAFGDALSYWRFFPAPNGWGRIPGWAEVARSEHPDFEVGERLYGYVRCPRMSW